MGQTPNPLMDQFMTLVMNGDQSSLQSFVTTNKEDIQTWFGQNQSTLSKLPNNQAAYAAAKNFFNGSGSAADFTTLQNFVKLMPAPVANARPQQSSTPVVGMAAPCKNEDCKDKNCKNKDHKKKNAA